ncbi:DUF1573 domain-containing protein [Candidatus Nomurabacteria bacterium]|nr:DUF1573 domain-containing protein [Candidatus Nomurabacteria bacterium]
MNEKTIISLIVIVIGIASLVWWSKYTEKEELSAKSHPARIEGIFAPTETFYDFGTISMKNGNVSKVFSVNNSSNENIKISSLSTSCMCTNAYIVRADGTKKGPFGMPGHGGGATRANEIVKAGGSLSIEVVYDPNAHGPAGVGMINRFIYLEDESGNRLQFEVKANVTP